MPHQCLKCGQAFAEGSREVLKGCSACGGTRFFFTREPLGQAEREELLRKSSRELKQILHDLAAEARAQGPAKDPTGKEWVPLDAKSLRSMLNEALVEEKAARAVPMPSVREYVERRALESGPPTPWPVHREARDAAAPAAPATEPVAEPAREVPRKLAAAFRHKDELRVDEKRGWGELPPPKPRSAPPKTVAPLPRPVKAPVQAPPAPLPTTTAPDAADPDLSKWQEGRAPEVVSIQAPGKYEIDVEGLLAHQPIVVAKDGTYLIHLPSVFEELGKRGRA